MSAVLPGGTLSFSFDGPEASGSDMLVEFWARGDFDAYHEWAYINLTADSYDFGYWLDNNDSNDVISGSDVGDQYSSVLYGTAVISEAALESILDDGILSFMWDYSTSVHDLGYHYGNIELAKVQISYDASDPVPEPATMLLLGTGLIGLAGARRKMKS